MEVPADQTAGGFVWSVHPARRHPWSLAFAFAVAVGVSVLAAELFREWWVGFAVFGTLLFVMRGFLLETRTEVGPGGVEVACWPTVRGIAWEDLGRLRVGEEVLILDRAGRGRWRPSLVVPFPPERDRVVRLVRRYSRIEPELID